MSAAYGAGLGLLPLGVCVFPPPKHPREGIRTGEQDVCEVPCGTRFPVMLSRVLVGLECSQQEWIRLPAAALGSQGLPSWAGQGGVASSAP